MSHSKPDFPGLDVQKCYEVIEKLSQGTKTYTSQQQEELKNEFWGVLESEINKINSGYTEREGLCVQRFKMFDFNTFAVSKDTSNMEILSIFQEALREVYPHFETAQMSISPMKDDASSANDGGGNSGSGGVGNKACKFEKSNRNLYYYAQYHSFCELLRDVHLLRDFTIQTFNILTILIGEIRKYCYTPEEVLTINDRFRSLCSLPLYTSRILAKLCTRTEVIATSLLCSQNGCAPQQTAFVCFHCHSLSRDMYVLRCFHRFCRMCTDYLTSEGAVDCPTCGRHSALTDLERDEPLRAFISTHFSAELAHYDVPPSAMDPAGMGVVTTTASATGGGGSNATSSSTGANGSVTNTGSTFIPQSGVGHFHSGMPAYMIGQKLMQAHAESNLPPMLNAGQNGYGMGMNGGMTMGLGMGMSGMAGVGRMRIPRARGRRGRPKGSVNKNGRKNKSKKNAATANSGDGDSVMGNCSTADFGDDLPPSLANQNGGDGANATSTSSTGGNPGRLGRKTGRAKTSCHQCKNNKDPGELLFCKNVKWGPGKKKGNFVLKHCRKKFCGQCMGKYIPYERVEQLFNQQEQSSLAEWKCPACDDTCECAACWRRRTPNASMASAAAAAAATAVISHSNGSAIQAESAATHAAEHALRNSPAMLNATSTSTAVMPNATSTRDQDHDVVMNNNARNVVTSSTVSSIPSNTNTNPGALPFFPPLIP